MAGFLLTFVGYALVLVVAHLIRLAGVEPILSLRPVGGLLVLVGSILLGVMTIRARVLPWWCGVVLIVGFPLGALLETVRSGIENIVFAVVWGVDRLRALVAERHSSRTATLTHELNFLELRQSEVRRISLLSTSVNRG